MRTRSSRPSGHACSAEGTLRLSSGTDGVLCPPKGYEEGVPLRVDLVATVPLEHLAQQPAVALECVPISISAQWEQVAWGELEGSRSGEATASNQRL